MDQLSFAEAVYQSKKRRTRREIFLARMEQLIPWAALEAQIGRHYPQGRQGRPPYRLSVMLRVHCPQLFYNLSDPAMEDALYEIASMRLFAGLRLSDPLPDETTILHFRHFLERHDLGQVVLAVVNQHLAQHGLMLRECIKASIRAKVEHPFRYIKRVFGYEKVRYRGLARNTHRLYWLAAFTNLLIGSRYLPSRA
ncbi:transposase [Thermithiobacillus plumbiphilus]|uniref:Transposase n=1 Tax=Thermithiobacillus plumbiphilus TaxID=1729899 RepID=A0ABU9DBE5_9PROT